MILFTSAFLALTLCSTAAMAVGTFEVITEVGGSFFGHFLTLSFDGSGIMANTNMYYSDATGWITIEDGQFSRITGDGMKVVGTTPFDGLNTAGRWDPACGWILFDQVDGAAPCGADLMSGYAGDFMGAKATGLAWVGACDAEAFLWEEGVGNVGLGRNEVEDRSSRGSDISDDGLTVGGFFENNACGRRPAIWYDGGEVQFPLGEDTCGEVIGVNSDGTMLCGSAIAPDAFTATAFFWSAEAGWVDIGTLPSDPNNGSIAVGIADNGWTVGFNSNPFFGFPEALIWTPEDGTMPFIEFLDMMGVEYPEGTYFYSCTDISADATTIVGNSQAPGGFLLDAFKVVLEDVVAVFLSDFDVSSGNGGVNVSFQVAGGALPSDFELVASLGNLEWTVPVSRDGSTFIAHDTSSNLIRGGTVTYSLYYFGQSGRELMGSQSVEIGETPVATRLIGASPNPFNPMTKVYFSLARPQHVKVTVFDLTGSRVAVLADGIFQQGEQSVQWNGTDASGRAVASGTYSVRMESQDGVEMQKMSLVR
jgi:hypothetical protein